MPNGRPHICSGGTGRRILEEFSTLVAAHTMRKLNAQASPDGDLLGRDPPHQGRNTPVAAKARSVPPSTEAAAGVGNASPDRAGATTERADQRHAIRLRANNGRLQPGRPEARPVQPPAARLPVAAPPRFPGPLRPTAPAPAASPKSRTAAPRPRATPAKPSPRPSPRGDTRARRADRSGSTQYQTPREGAAPDQPDAGTPRRDPRAKPHDSRIPESTP
jgi:hypothetical protein